VKALLRRVKDGDLQYEALMFWCPGCERPGEDGPVGGLHMLPVSGDCGTKPRWDFDGDLEAPTLSPSILTNYRTWDGTDPEDNVCHSFLRAGVFEFLGDCTHALAGQHVPMPNLPEWVL
jgi:hypothetical protein